MKRSSTAEDIVASTPTETKGAASQTAMIVNGGILSSTNVVATASANATREVVAAKVNKVLLGLETSRPMQSVR